MPSINEVIERVYRAHPDSFDQETKAAWLIEFDGKLYRDSILRHRVPIGKSKKGVVTVCPVCGATGSDMEYNGVLDANRCTVCDWTDVPQPPRVYPDDGDKPLLVGSPDDMIYDRYLIAMTDLQNKDGKTYGVDATVSDVVTGEWKRWYHRTHLPVPAGDAETAWMKGEDAE